MKRIVRLSALALALLVTVSVFSGCDFGKKGPDPTGEPTTAPTEAVVEKTDAPEATPAVKNLTSCEVTTYKGFDDYLPGLGKITENDAARSQESALMGAEECKLARVLVKGIPDFTGFSPSSVTLTPWGVYIVQFEDPTEALAFMNAQKWNPDVEYAEEDREVSSEDTEVVPLASGESLFSSWGTAAIDAFTYINYIRNQGLSRQIIVAVIDTGVNFTHVDLAGHFISTGYDFIENDTVAQDEKGHGSHVTGTIIDCTQGLPVKILPLRAMTAAI